LKNNSEKRKGSKAEKNMKCEISKKSSVPDRVSGLKVIFTATEELVSEGYPVFCSKGVLNLFLAAFCALNPDLEVFECFVSGNDLRWSDPELPWLETPFTLHNQPEYDTESRDHGCLPLGR
jgi:hypothetical protein